MSVSVSVSVCVCVCVFRPYLSVGVELALVQPGMPVQLQHVVELLLGQAEVGVVRIRVRIRSVVAQQDALRPQDTGIRKTETAEASDRWRPLNNMFRKTLVQDFVLALFILEQQLVL